MKEKIKEILKKYEENKIEILLMCLFVIVGLSFGLSEIVQETVSRQVQTETETETEYETETQLMTETETETESLRILEESLQKKLAVCDETFRIPMLWEMDRMENCYTGTAYGRWQLLRAYDLYRLEHHWKAYEENTKIGQLFEMRTERPLSELESILSDKISGYDGTWSVYVKNLGTNESFVLNDRPMKSASVMKLFIMGTVYKAFESGELERTDEIMELVHDMIEYSDNGDSNRLLYLLGDESYEHGIQKVDAFIREYGFSDMTIEYNGFNDPATNMGTGQYNQVSAKDCGKLLEDIYRRNWVNRAVSNEMEAMLLAQNTRYKIPAGLPDGVLCGNKTGEMDTTENDAAIIYAEECDYILVVLSSDWGSKDTAIERIRSISAAVYDFLEK